MSPADTAWAWPWWTVMVIINSCNVMLCALFYRHSLNAIDGRTAYRRTMRIMGLVFVVVALYRAIFVSRYLTQMGWFDTLANSSLIIRSFAVFAEIGFYSRPQRAKNISADFYPVARNWRGWNFNLML